MIKVEGGGPPLEGVTLNPALPEFLLQLLESLLVLDFHPESLVGGRLKYILRPGSSKENRS